MAGRQVTLFLAAVACGFLIFLLLTSSGVGFVAALPGLAAPPLAMLIFLLCLCCGKPEGYASHWWQWRRLRAAGQPLLSIPTPEHHESR